MNDTNQSDPKSRREQKKDPKEKREYNGKYTSKHIRSQQFTPRATQNNNDD